MNNYVVFQPASKFREVARGALSGKWGLMFAGMLIYFLFSTVMETVLNYFFHILRYVELIDGYYYTLQINYAGNLYSMLVSGPLTCGLIMFLMACFRDKKVDYGLTLEGFGMFWKAFSLYIIYSVKIWLWSLLFVIPGIIATFRYSMCFYLRVDHPDWTAGQCIRESGRLMRGNKWKLFTIQFSFIGWAFLAALISTVFEEMASTGITYIVIVLIGQLPLLLVTMYMRMAELAFYELLTGNLIIEGPNGIPYSDISPDNETYEDVIRKREEQRDRDEEGR